LLFEGQVAQTCLLSERTAYRLGVRVFPRCAVL